MVKEPKKRKKVPVTYYRKPPGKVEDWIEIYPKKELVKKKVKRKKKPKKPSREKLLDKTLTQFSEWLKKQDPKGLAGMGLFVAGTLALHKLNLAGMINYFGQAPDMVATGLPYPFARRRRMPWEQDAEPTLVDRVTEWTIPAILSWQLVYHPEAVAQLIDAVIPL